MSNSKYSNTLGDDDYLVSEVPNVPLWNETMVCTTDDPVTGISSSFYLGRWWGKPDTLRQMVTFLLPGDRALFARNFAPCPDSGPPSVAGLTIAPLGDGRIRCTFDGPMELRSQSDVAKNGVGTGPTVRVQADCTFHPSLPIYDVHAGDKHAEDDDIMFPGGHMEQLGLVSGWFTFNGETYELKNAPSIRDHSRGVRDFRRHHYHTWMNCQFPGGWGFCGYRGAVRGQEGPAMNSYAVFKDGKIYAATLETEGQIFPGTDIWAPFRAVLYPDGLDPIQLEIAKIWHCYQIGMYDPADVYWGVPTRADEKAAFSLEQAMEVRANGETGFGHLERCNRDIVIDDHWRRMCTPDRMDRNR